MVKAKSRKEVSSSDHSMGKVRIKSPRNNCPDELSDEKGKRKDLLFEVQEKGVKRKKRKINATTAVEEKAETKDYFSHLPEDIVHHILGLLQSPKDAARISILSKKWKSIWDSFPTFDFDQRCFEPQCQNRKRIRNHGGGTEMVNFIRAVDKSCATRLEAISYVRRFKLHMTDFWGVFAPHMNRWIQAVAGKNVKELDIHLNDKRRRYRLPQVVFSCKGITSLKLYGLRLDESTDIRLYNLRLLSIKNAQVDVNIIKNFVSSCPLIEDLRLVYCKGLDCLRVSTLAKLNRVEVHECSGLGGVEIDAANLSTFWFCGEKDSDCTINLAGCGNLKVLTLKNINITDDRFQDLISNSPNLEKLALMDCNRLERIVILSEKIKRLSILRCWKLKDADMDAPPLISFEYTGDKVPFFSMNISRLHEVKLSFPPLKKKSSCLLKLRKFLGKFNQFEGFKLFVCSKKNVTVYEEMKGVEILPSRPYNLELTKSSKMLRDLVDSHLLKNHPQNLNVVSSPSSKFLKFIQELIIGRTKNPECCRYYSMKCWRHHLKEANMLERCGTSDKTTFELKWNPKIKPDDKVDKVSSRN